MRQIGACYSFPVTLSHMAVIPKSADTAANKFCGAERLFDGTDQEASSLKWLSLENEISGRGFKVGERKDPSKVVGKEAHPVVSGKEITFQLDLSFLCPGSKTEF